MTGAPTGSGQVPTVEQDVERYHHLEANRQAIVEEQEAIKARVRDRLSPGKHELATGVVTVGANRRFDPKLAEPILGQGIAAGRITPDEVKGCWKTTLDSAAVKRIVSPDVYEQCMKDAGTPRVSIA